MKQTAVEWLVEKIKSQGLLIGEIDNLVAVKQAKEMEKEQIIKARNNGFLASGEGWNGEYGIEDINLLTKEIKSEQYYNETYESNT